MLEKFIEMVEHQAAANELRIYIEDFKEFDICSNDSIQLMDSAQPLFDGFCEHFNLTPRITIDTEYTPHQRTQLVRYKGLKIYVFGDVENG